MIEKRVREKQGRRAAPSQQRSRSKTDDVDTIMNVDEFRRQLGNVLLAKKANAQELVSMWDRSRDGLISKMEFRVGVRNSLGLHVHIDAVDTLFRQFDEDGGGELDVPELKEALEYLKDKAAKDAVLREQLQRSVATFPGRIGALETAIANATRAVEAAHDEVAKHVAYRERPKVDARLGTELAAKVRSDERPDGLELDELVKRWEEGCKKSGLMSRDEFVRHAAVTVPGSGAGAGRPTLSSGLSVGMSVSESKEKDKEFHCEQLKTAGFDVNAVEAQFDEWDRRTQESKLQEEEPPRGWVPIGVTIKAMLQAHKDDVAEEAVLQASTAACRGTALAEQEGLRIKVEEHHNLETHKLGDN